jgi:hypothetical protein
VSKFARVEIRGILARPNLAKEILERNAKAMAEELAKFGAERMREYVRTRGTAFSEVAQSAGINMGPGRMRTGKMYESINYRVESGGSKTIAAFGWIQNFEQYFLYQELGFRNKFIAAYTPTGRLIVRDGGPIIRRNPFGGYKNTKGMFALRDARADTESRIPALAKKYRGKITREINGR